MVNRFSFKYLFTSFLLVTSLSCIEKQSSAIYLNPEPLNEILNRYVEGGIWPFLYSKIVDGNSGDVVYEHLAVNKRHLRLYIYLLPAYPFHRSNSVFT